MYESSSDKQQETGMDALMIPIDLLEEILSRLPVKSLVRFESVSKLWRSVIRSQGFSELYRRSHRRLKILASYDRRSPRSSIGPPTMFIGSSRSAADEEEEICYMHYNVSEAFSCCDGLVCSLGLNSESIDIFNPSTRQFRRFPPSGNFGLSSVRSRHVFPNLDLMFTNVLYPDMFSRVMQRTRLPRCCPIGFGRDNVTATYKVVRLYSQEEFACLVCTDCAVLALDDNTPNWRYVSSVPYLVFRGQNSVHANGSVYWFTVHLWDPDGQVKILAFDLHTEAFRTVPHPLPFCSKPSHLVELVCLGDRLCLSDVRESSSQLEIWSMEPDERWERMCRISLDGVRKSLQTWLFTPLTVCEKGRVVFWDHNGRLYKYYPETKMVRLISQETWVLAPYMETLVRIP